MKKCFKCNELKALDEFYRHPGMDDGHLGKCKSCTKVDVQQNYRKNKDYYKAYDKERNKTPKRKLKYYNYLKAYRNRNPEKAKAHRLVNYAVSVGKLIKQPCEFCGSKVVDAHHTDYSKPLDVHWLCSQHHHDVHNGYKELQ